MFSARGRYQFINILQKVTKWYNYKIHFSISIKSVDVTPDTRLNVYTYLKIALKPKFPIGNIPRNSTF